MFKRVAIAYHWPADTWVLRLAPLLTCKALAAFANMDREAAQGYDAVKEAILRRYDISEETYRQRFRSAKRKSEESFTVLGVRLQAHYHRRLLG